PGKNPWLKRGSKNPRLKNNPRLKRGSKPNRLSKRSSKRSKRPKPKRLKRGSKIRGPGPKGRPKPPWWKPPCMHLYRSIRRNIAIGFGDSALAEPGNNKRSGQSRAARLGRRCRGNHQGISDRAGEGATSVAGLGHGWFGRAHHLCFRMMASKRADVI